VPNGLLGAGISGRANAGPGRANAGPGHANAGPGHAKAGPGRSQDPLTLYPYQLMRVYLLSSPYS